MRNAQSGEKRRKCHSEQKFHFFHLNSKGKKLRKIAWICDLATVRGGHWLKVHALRVPAKTFLANVVILKQLPVLLCIQRSILLRWSVSKPSRWKSKSMPDGVTPIRLRWSDCPTPRSRRARTGSPRPFPIADCAGRTEKGLPSILLRPTSGRKDPALIFRSLLAC